MTATMTAATSTTKTAEPITIKKYANRRLYNTGTSAYVTLEDLASMVKTGEDFVVYDAKSGDDITRSVLTQIIFEQENKEGQNLLPIAFLRQLIRFYGDSMQMLVPRYLEVSIKSLTREQEKFRHQMAQAFGVGGFPSLEDQVRRNMEMFERAFTMFAPFARRESRPPKLPRKLATHRRRPARSTISSVSWMRCSGRSIGCPKKARPAANHRSNGLHRLCEWTGKPRPLNRGEAYERALQIVATRHFNVFAASSSWTHSATVASLSRLARSVSVRTKARSSSIG